MLHVVTDTPRMDHIAECIEEDGWMMYARAVRAITRERDALTAQLSYLRSLSALRHSMAITPDVPEGYDTILGYLAKHHPEVLDAMDYTDPNATQRDGFWMMHHAGDRRVVGAPPVLRACGIYVVNAWPLAALAERFG